MAQATVIATIDPADRGRLLVAVSDANGPVMKLGKANFSVLMWANQMGLVTEMVPVASADPATLLTGFEAFYELRLGEVSAGRGGTPAADAYPTVFAVIVHQQPLVQGQAVDHLGATIATLAPLLPATPQAP
jgi:hypothetical protein